MPDFNDILFPFLVGRGGGAKELEEIVQNQAIVMNAAMELQNAFENGNINISSYGTKISPSGKIKNNAQEDNGNQGQATLLVLQKINSLTDLVTSQAKEMKVREESWFIWF